MKTITEGLTNAPLSSPFLSNGGRQTHEQSPFLCLLLSVKTVTEGSLMLFFLLFLSSILHTFTQRRGRERQAHELYFLLVNPSVLVSEPTKKTRSSTHQHCPSSVPSSVDSYFPSTVVNVPFTLAAPNTFTWEVKRIPVS